MKKLFVFFAMAFIGLYSFAQIGSTCSTPFIINSVPFTLSASNDSTGDNYDNICGSVYSDENDFVLEYTPANDIYVSITTSGTNPYTGLFVTNGCPDIGSCVNYNEAPLGNPLLGTVFLTGGNTYYIVISTNDPTGYGLNTSTAFTIDINELPPYDAGVTAIYGPISGCSLTNSETINCTIKNYGADTISNFDVNYAVNGGTPVTETFTGSILPDSIADFTFSSPADLSGTGTFEIIAYTTLTGDTINTNDNDTTYIYSTPVISSFPYTQDFESTSYWFTYGNLSSWELGTPAGAVINSAASPTHAWVTNLTGNHNAETSYLEGPCFDLSSVATPRIQFNIWYETTQVLNTLAVEYSTDNGVTWQQLPSGSSATNWDQPWSGSSSGWVHAANTVPSLGGLPNVKFRFAFNAMLADNEGIGIDDIEISDCVAGVPVADFTYIQDTTHVVFINNSSNATSYYWDFGDFQTSSDSNPVHDYIAFSNSYTVMLVAMNDCNSDTTYQTIDVVVGNNLLSVNNQITIYPNPVKHNLTISTESNQSNTELKIKNIYILDLKGKQVKSIKTKAQSEYIVNLKKLPNGLYFVKVLTDKGTMIKKIVKQN